MSTSKFETQPLLTRELLQKFDARSNNEFGTGFFFCDLADVHFSNGNYSEAVRNFNLAIIVNPELYFLYEGRGYAYLKQKNYQEAIKDFSIALSYYPKNMSIYYYLGHAYFMQGNFSEAISHFTDLLILYPQDSHLHYYRGLSFFAQMSYDHALHDFITIPKSNYYYNSAQNLILTLLNIPEEPANVCVQSLLGDLIDLDEELEFNLDLFDSIEEKKSPPLMRNKFFQASDTRSRKDNAMEEKRSIHP